MRTISLQRVFAFSAALPSGEIVTGTVTAWDHADAKRLLRYDRRLRDAEITFS